VLLLAECERLTHPHLSDAFITYEKDQEDLEMMFRTP